MWELIEKNPTLLNITASSFILLGLIVFHFVIGMRPEAQSILLGSLWLLKIAVIIFTFITLWVSGFLIRCGIVCVIIVHELDKHQDESEQDEDHA